MKRRAPDSSGGHALIWRDRPDGWHLRIGPRKIATVRATAGGWQVVLHHPQTGDRCAGAARNAAKGRRLAVMEARRAGLISGGN